MYNTPHYYHQLIRLPHPPPLTSSPVALEVVEVADRHTQPRNTLLSGPSDRRRRAELYVAITDRKALFARGRQEPVRAGNKWETIGQEFLGKLEPSDNNGPCMFGMAGNNKYDILPHLISFSSSSSIQYKKFFDITKERTELYFNFHLSASINLFVCLSIDLKFKWHERSFPPDGGNHKNKYGDEFLEWVTTTNPH